MQSSQRMVVAVVVALSVVAGAYAQDRPAKPVGVWEREVGGNKIKFDIKADGLKVVLNLGAAQFNLDIDYGVTKEGVLYGIITKVQKQGSDSGPTEGELFSFRIAQVDNKLTISDLKGAGQDGAKDLVEGDYKKTGN